MFKRIKGTQDFLDLSLFNFIIDQAKKHLKAYNFIEIATPIIEPLDMYRRSTGQETEVVSKQMFKIVSQHENEEICLRPEATPSAIRAFIENNVENTPWKVFTWGPMFRYERPQKGRYRQFHQISIEVIGSDSVSQDAHFIKMMDRFFTEKLSLDNYVILINYLGCSADRQIFQENLKNFLDNKIDKVCQECKNRRETNILRIFDCKNPECQEIYKDAPVITDFLCQDCSIEWETLKEQLLLLSVNYVLDPRLVRGLDYYCKTVFEFVSQNLGAQSSFCGGGRYNSLVSQLGGKVDQPSVGVGIGVERVLLLLEQMADKLVLPQEPALNLILPMDKEQNTLALLLADTLQNSGLCVDILLEGGSIKSMMRRANKMGAKYVLILGEQEQKDKTVTIKNMITGESNTVLQIDAIKRIK
ncbi:MAG: Histidine-tRNA ligase [candidate division TM6 bacterium GW2011_GWF2_30_66]|jgi:histidyl-tRNA synthetase|nr:MAG: Histidine-tRNA ligase [candidate division TM6 bacterium GW2011_GWF2_30_66]